MRYTRTALGLLNAQYRSVLKKCLLINLGLFALGAGVANADAAETLSPTLDSLKEQAQKDGAVSKEAYTLTKLNSGAKVPEGDAAVRIGKNVYYFSPKGDEDAKLLSILAGTPVASVDNVANPSTIKFDVTNISTKFPSSVFSYVEVKDPKNGYNFVVQEAGQDGNITKKYYKIDLNTDNMHTSEAIKWSSTEPAGATGSVEVKLPNSAKPTKLYYTVTETEYDKVKKNEGDRLTDLAGDVGSATKKFLFKGLKQISDSSAAYGGAIYNTSTDGYNIYADFIGNNTSSSASRHPSFGGAILNDEDGIIGDITGDFIGNYASSSSSSSSAALGGAILNSEYGTIGNITGDFIGNYASSSYYYYPSAIGGAIYNDKHGTIGNITGDFIGNYAYSSSLSAANAHPYVYGGAIDNNSYGTIGNISGDFIGNYASSSSSYDAHSYGGAIYNYDYGTIGNITGDFIGNYVSSSYPHFYSESSGSASGGVIYNSGTIGNITGDFIGNYAYSFSSYSFVEGGAIDNYGTIGDITGDFIGNYASSSPSSSRYSHSYGGAIYNKGTIGNITGDFIGNYASSTATNSSSYGGAICNKGTLTIAGASTFTDNYVEVNGEKTSNAIHNEGTINFNGTNIVVNDAITGENGTINIASSSNGMTTFNNSVSGNTVNLIKGTLKLGHYTSEKFGDSEGSFADDVDFVANGGVLNLGDQKVSLKSAEFNDGSTLAINVKSDGNGLLKANSLTINGGQLKATLGQGVVDMQNKHKTVTLLESGTEFVNKFADVADNNMYRFEKAEKAGDYIISLAKTAEDVSQENGGTQNNTETAKGWVDGNKFEQGSVSADVADKLADLAQNDAKGFNEALSALAPSDTPEVRTNSVNHNTEMFRAVVSHLDDVSKKSQYGLSSGDVVDGVSVWAKAFGNHAKVDNTSKAYGFKSDGYGATLGIEKQLNNAFKVGLGYSYFYNDVDGFMRDSDVNTHTGFVYGEYRPNNWYTNAIASYGYSEYEENKHVAGDVYKAKYDVDNIGAQVMTGYNASVAKVDVTPETGLRYNNIHRDNYVDSAGQAVKAETMDVLTAVAGLKVGKDLVSCFGLHEVYWRPEARLAATYDLISDKENAVVSLSNGSGYVVKGQRLNRFGVEAGAGVTFYLSQDVESSVGYEGKFRSHYQDHTGYVSAKYKF